GLDLVALPVQRGGDEGVAVALDAADEGVDLAAVQQQLAGATVVGDDMGGGRDQRRDLRAEQEQLAAADDRVALGDVGAPGADRLQLPALQRQAGLQALLQVVLVARTLVQRHGPAALCLILVAILLAHGGIVAVCRVPWRCPPPRTDTADGSECRPSSAAPSSNIPPRACSPWSTTSPPIRAASTGARRRTCSSPTTPASSRAWTWASVRCAPGSPPRTPCRRRTTSRWPCARGHSSGWTGAGSSMRWTNRPAR